MTPEILIELFGYLGSTLVVVSMLMASLVKLRVINTIGSVISAIYALIIGSFPLALMNVCLIVINLYGLFRLLKTPQQYDIVPCGVEDCFVRYFLEKHQADISGFFPDIQKDALAADAAYLVCCNGDPAGLVLGRDLGDGQMDLILDYSVPAYRDCSVGQFLYANLKAHDVRILRFSRKATQAHVDYMKKMGFGENQGEFTLELK